ncbi:hypothetical protein C8Q73DRAFT_670834 [Cubamyces lactineus]|nr:hypothetical protein C8Q73DRAFT_670834 [Cubamyces lactineus]
MYVRSCLQPFLFTTRVFLRAWQMIWAISIASRVGKDLAFAIGMICASYRRCVCASERTQVSLHAPRIFARTIPTHLAWTLFADWGGHSGPTPPDQNE